MTLQVAPRPRGSGNDVRLGDFLPADPKEAAKILPPALVDAALSGVRDALQCGDLTGYPVEDVEVVITAIARQEGLTTAPGCHMAAGAALREALAAASPVALEPVMHVEISVPDDFLGAAIGLFGGCGGKVDDLQDRNGLKQVNDLYGHAAGDALIRKTVQCIDGFFRNKCYRIGGDEIIVADDSSDEATFRRNVELARRCIERTRGSVSIGISWRDEACFDEQFYEADRAMYDEKKRFYRLKEHDRRRG